MMYGTYAPKRYKQPAPQREVFAEPPVSYTTDQTGQYRIQNNSAAGYLIWIGINGMPDLTKAPDAFSASLPITISQPLPGSGIQSLYVVPRYRDSYGCVSQNSHPWIIYLSPSGEVFAPLPTPQSIAAYPRANGNINIIGQYPSYVIDSHVAGKVRVWVSTGTPDPTTAPTFEGGALTQSWSIGFGNYSPGTYNLVMCYYRTSDGAISPLVSATVIFPDLPTAPTPLFTENIT